MRGTAQTREFQTTIATSSVGVHKWKKKDAENSLFYVVSLFMNKIIFSYCATKFLSIYELPEGLIKEHSLVHVKSRKR